MPGGVLAGSTRRRRKVIRDWFSTPQKPKIALAAEVDGEMAGSSLPGRKVDEAPGSTGEIYSVQSAPPANRGLGKQLMDAALPELRRRYSKFIWAFRQARSGPFYRKLGFEIVADAHTRLAAGQRWIFTGNT